MTRYSTIVADPPWQVKAGRPLGAYVLREDGTQGFGPRGQSARELAYPTMTLEEMAALPVNDLAADDAHLYLWTVNKYLGSAFALAASWGFTYSTALVWAKSPMGGGLGGCYGIATEFVLFCRRGSLPALQRVGRNWFNWKRPYKNGYPHHSAKPPEFFAMVERVSPGPYLEMFARAPRAGWDVHGNEVLGIAV